ncbi:AAA family ATPase [Altericroceibacterium spongiae]|uniref:AAA family ATPase n=1 Tax=Altericroceibacterium spongiae TaxID=2320269 RepID=UPI0026809255
MPEAGRVVIREQSAVDGSAMPWNNRNVFADKMLEQDLRSYEEAQAQGGIVFFDRGIPDIIGYRILCGLDTPRQSGAGIQGVPLQSACLHRAALAGDLRQ